MCHGLDIETCEQIPRSPRWTVPTVRQMAVIWHYPFGTKSPESVASPFSQKFSVRRRVSPLFGFSGRCAKAIIPFQVPCPIVAPFSFQVLFGTSLASCIGESQETDGLQFELEDTMTSNAIQQNEPNRSSRRGDHRLQKVSVFLNRIIPSDPTFLDAAVGEITRAIGGTTFWGDVEGIGLAVREALANAMIHGNDSDPAKPVTISVAVNESCDLLIIIRDSGSGFDPKRVPDPTVGDSLLASHGRGIFLMQKLMDQVDFRFGQGTEVIMRRKRQWLQ
jgi:anti-sigma regulatory factor (Ser/Thr protein kinase)